MRSLKKRAAIVAATVTPLVVLALPAPQASAHGWITSPPSRQQQCKAGTVSCGQIQWEPQSVEGPKGLTSCHGGNSRFAELNDDSKGWAVTDINRTQSFNWQITANHRTSTWQYFVGGQKVAEFNDGGAQPPSQFSHTVNFGNITGRQKVLAVWNVYDTGNAFYACIDVNIR
ncbi:lytic polysaccharide monooxygenase auxiliary activity family 9 protein [Streptomyces sp. CMB-StM0423]|uniref:lytic polysaccharide monooxygenase auxiliary activity family 9 protein n=1 Tax=Streptomyces sp. CMB-StM0423 TaxID=2059884 RepID=UPI000C7077D9|nr:lytic polysaccharide monooxygenase auxiliary activity family 9 protein [Streptomyces sp. CMB-StM0423]AUH44372.1 chitin-binding protein [Streptomyces sp. CMB-StM0423]